MNSPSIRIVAEHLVWEVDVSRYSGDRYLIERVLAPAGISAVAQHFNVPLKSEEGRRLCALGTLGPSDTQIDVPRGVLGEPVWGQFDVGPAPNTLAYIQTVVGVGGSLAPPSLEGIDRAVLLLAGPFERLPPVDALSGIVRVAIVDVDSLRNVGARIPIGLSWESVLTGAATALRVNPALRALAQCERVIVLFGHEAVLIATRGGHTSAMIVVRSFEGDLRRMRPGSRPGADERLTAGLATLIAEHGVDATMADPQAILDLRRREGMPRLLLEGTRLVSQVAVEYPMVTCSTQVPESGGWAFLDTWSPARIESAAHLIVTEGLEAAQDLHLATFGPLCGISPNEIDDIAEVQRQIRDYVNRADPPRPLCIGVFGPPGSGKSFAVRSLTNACDPDLFREVTVNVGLLSSPEALAAAFNGARDAAAGHKVPLIFFDEFDSALGDRPLGWLPSFLAPMQDSVYRDGAQLHPLGRCIFVFAGGVHATYREFEEAAAKDILGKGPDFLSRLRGALEVAPIDPTGGHPVGRELLLRRAVLIRSLIQRRTPNILNGTHARIDPSVLRAILHVRRWRHSVRSIEALFDMSVLAGVTSFVPACLPAVDTLSMHVDASEFMQWVQLNELGPIRERLAQHIHEQHIQSALRRGISGQGGQGEYRPWGDLPEPVRESYRREADFIFEQLEAIGRPLDPLGNGDVALSEEEVELLARRHHQWWIEDRISQGWSLGPADGANRVTPLLLPWTELDSATQQLTEDAVRTIPDLIRIARTGSIRHETHGAEA